MNSNSSASPADLSNESFGLRSLVKKLNSSRCGVIE